MMKRLLIPGIILVVILAPLLLVVQANRDVEAGKAVYDKKCAACHGKEGVGNEKVAATLKVEIRPLGSKEVQEKNDEQIKKDFTTDHGKKKAVKGLSDDDITNLIAYVRTLKQK